MKQELSKIKNSLKEFYQKQLDSVLREKVDEFQKEIDNAQATIHLELHKQEKLADDKLQTEIRRLKEAYVSTVIPKRLLFYEFMELHVNCGHFMFLDIN